MSLIAELKRRNVFRVAVAYVIVGWLAMQVGEVMAPALRLPDWVMSALAFFIIIGFPFALFFAWAFELTPEGLRKERNVDRSQSITHITSGKLDRLIISVLVLALAWFAFDKFVLDPARDEARVVKAVQSATATADDPADGLVDTDQSIAVLPFVNMSDDKDYFADGLSEELLNLLAKMPELKVAGRTSSFAFKGQNDDLRAIGEALGVAHVLEGSVRRSGERLRITAQLVNVEDGFHLWSETYDRQMADIFDIQDDVSRAISEALRLHLLPQQDPATESPEAYALYLEALAVLSSPDRDRFMELVDAALALDPGFARAWELKAVFYWLGDGTRTNPDSQRLVYESATRALELDPDLVAARAYARSADLHNFSILGDFDALTELIELTPNDFFAYETLCWNRTYSGYFQQAADAARRGLELEPLSSAAHAMVASSAMAQGRRELAMRHWRRVADLGDASGLKLMAWAEFIEGNDEAGIALWEEYQAQADGGPRDIRAFVSAARAPDTGAAFLAGWIAEQDQGDYSFYRFIDGRTWYLVLGHLDEYWRVIREQSPSDQGWSDADTLLFTGMVFRTHGFTAHPEYARWAGEMLAPVWDARGAPDHCQADDEGWQCG